MAIGVDSRVERGGKDWGCGGNLYGCGFFGDVFGDGDGDGDGDGNGECYTGEMGDGGGAMVGFFYWDFNGMEKRCKDGMRYFVPNTMYIKRNARGHIPRPVHTIHPPPTADRFRFATQLPPYPPQPRPPTQKDYKTFMPSGSSPSRCPSASWRRRRTRGSPAPASRSPWRSRSGRT